MATELAEWDSGELSLYFATEEGELADLEVAAAAAIQWAQGLKAAAAALDPLAEYRVTLVAARPGSSNWIAKLEKLRDWVEETRLNQATEKAKARWQKVPLIVRVGIGLAVVIPLTAKPTIDYWFGNDGFTETQKQEMMEIYRRVVDEPSVKAHRNKIYKEAPRDRKITGIGTGVPTGTDWKPANTLPANRFAEADGLFDLQVEEADRERTIPQTLDVILVTPRLENARRAWTFRQEGIPGTFNAEMADPKFLAALDRAGGIRETLRANIPMRIRLDIKQERVDGEWRVTRRGRKVVEVISPAVE